MIATVSIDKKLLKETCFNETDMVDSSIGAQTLGESDMAKAVRRILD